MTCPRAIVVFVAALTLTACGKVGSLDQPAPLYGEKAKADYAARRAAAAASAQDKKDQDQIEPLPAPAAQPDPAIRPQ